MNVFVLFGQRKCTYPGEYGLEALACMDEYGHSENPDYLEDERSKYEENQEFDRLSILKLSVSEQDVRSALYPESAPISASVTSAG